MVIEASGRFKDAWKVQVLEQEDTVAAKVDLSWKEAPQFGLF